ncbi:hypothetical protein G3N93_39575, partial [Burkholderia sp. Se-20378]|nr:hypothetical protein [Burkholderia sp. Se-20378]
MNDPRGPATFAPDTDAPAFDRAALARAIDALRAGTLVPVLPAPIPHRRTVYARC